MEKNARTFDFGKIDYRGTGRRLNRVEVTVELNDDHVSVTGVIWNSRMTDALTCGQIHDDLDGFFKGNPTWSVLSFLWNQYHLNDLHPGTPRQEALVKGLDYNRACSLLKAKGLYVVPASEADPYRKWPTHRGQSYRYGHEWLTWPIPEDILTATKIAIDTGDTWPLHEVAATYQSRSQGAPKRTMPETAWDLVV